MQPGGGAYVGQEVALQCLLLAGCSAQWGSLLHPSDALTTRVLQPSSSSGVQGPSYPGGQDGPASSSRGCGAAEGSAGRRWSPREAVAAARHLVVQRSFLLMSPQHALLSLMALETGVPFWADAGAGTGTEMEIGSGTGAGPGSGTRSDPETGSGTGCHITDPIRLGEVVVQLLHELLLPLLQVTSYCCCYRYCCR